MPDTPTARKMTFRQIALAYIERQIERRRKHKVISPVLHPDTFQPYPVTYPYGVKSRAYQAGHHTGEDHACPVGSLAVAVSFGRVMFVGDGGKSGGWGPYYGTQVIIRTGNGTYDYAHNHLSKVEVSVGDRVRPGMIVGRTGQTGNVTGPHDHFEARTAGGRYGSDVHPMRVKRIPA